MSEHDVVLGGACVGVLATDTGAVRAAGGASAPTLLMNLRVHLRAIRANADTKLERPVIPLSVVQALASLEIRGVSDFAHALPTVLELETMNVPREVGAGLFLRFPLSAHAVHELENARNAGDMELIFRIGLQLAVHAKCEEAQETQRSQGTVAGQRRTPVERFAMTWTQIQHVVPKSTWARDLLPGLGFGKRHVVEIAVPSPPDDARFERARAHLDAAWTAFGAGDAAGAMARCWKLWEAVVVEFLGPGRVPRQETFEELLRRAGVPETKVAKLKALLYDLASFNHLGRHDRDASPTPLDQRDAEFALIGTQLALGYLSRVGALSTSPGQ